MGDRIKQFKSDLLAIQNRVCKLQQDLDSKEDYINYLEKEISIWNKELDPLRLEISYLKEKLEKVIEDSKNQENYIDYIEKWLVIFQDEIGKLNEKILVLYKNSNDSIEMDQQPGSPEHYLFLKIKPRSKTIELGERLITLDNIFRVQLQ